MGDPADLFAIEAAARPWRLELTDQPAKLQIIPNRKHGCWVEVWTIRDKAHDGVRVRLDAAGLELRDPESEVILTCPDCLRI